MRTSLAAVALAVGAAVTVASDAPAHAATTGPALLLAPAQSYLKLTVRAGEQARPAQRRSTLICDPPAGTHPRAREACAALAAVGGDFSALHVDGGACTMQYDPVTVTAIGLWRGQPVRYRHTFGNGCVLRTETGPVFAL